MKQVLQIRINSIDPKSVRRFIDAIEKIYQITRQSAIIQNDQDGGCHLFLTLEDEDYD